MTKSRTLRKAAAVALSLAMALSVSGVTNADAAAKNSLTGSSSVQVGKKITLTVKKAGKTFAAKKNVTVKAGKAVTVVKKTKNKVTLKGAKAGKATVKVTAYPKKGKKFTVSKKITVKKKATVVDNDGDEEITGVVTIKSNNALQSDDSVLKGDELQVVIPKKVGAVADILWLKNDTAMDTTTTDKTFTTFDTGMPGAGAGVYQALVVSTGNKKYLSNSLTVTDKVAPTQITGFEIVEVYDDLDGNKVPGDAIEYDATSKSLVAHFTVNRLYKDTKFGICDATAAKKGFTHDTWTYPGTPQNGTDGNVDAKATAATVAKLGGGKATAGEDQKADIFVKLSTDGAKRGGKYVGMIDDSDTNITTDTPGEGKENVSAEAVAPYLVAPASLVTKSYVNAAGKGATLEFRDANGKACEWINGLAGQYAITLKGATKTDNSVAASDSFVAFTSEAKKGVVEDKVNYANRYYYATATLAKDIWGPTAVTLTANNVETAGDALTSMKLSQSSTNPTSATVSFKDLKSEADGTVYIVGGVFTNATAQTTTVADLLKEDVKKYKSASVKGGVGSVEVEGVFDEVKFNDKDQFIAVFVPANEEKFGRASAGKNEEKNATDAFVLKQSFKKYNAAIISVNSAATNGQIDSLGATDKFDKAMNLNEDTNNPGHPISSIAGSFTLTNTASNNNKTISLEITETGLIEIDATSGPAGTYAYTIPETGQKITVDVVTSTTAGGQIDSANNTFRGKITIS